MLVGPEQVEASVRARAVAAEVGQASGSGQPNRFGLSMEYAGHSSDDRGLVGNHRYAGIG